LSVGDERFEVENEQYRSNDERQDKILVNRDASTLQHPVYNKQTHK